MRLRSLRFPDLPRMQEDVDYSFAVRPLLIRAFRFLQRAPGDLALYYDAVDAATSALGQQMSVRQRIRIFYVLGSAFAAVGDYLRGLFWLEQAMTLAETLDDPGDLLDLYYLHGSGSRAALRYRDAAMDYRAYLHVIQRIGARPDALDAPLTLDVRAQLAGAEFFLGHFDSASTLLDQARAALPATAFATVDPELRLVAATIDWFTSQLYRWRGLPEAAVGPASRAARVYTDLGGPISAARSQLISAEIALDVAAKHPHEAGRRALAAMAQPSLLDGLRLAHLAGDPIGESLLSLAYTRFSRLAGRQEDRLAIIEQVARTAQQADDEALLAQAFTALGDELAAQGNVDAALHRYRDVRMLLDGSDVPALGIWALRAVHQATEVQRVP